MPNVNVKRAKKRNFRKENTNCRGTKVKANESSWKQQANMATESLIPIFFFICVLSCLEYQSKQLKAFILFYSIRMCLKNVNAYQLIILLKHFNGF